MLFRRTTMADLYNPSKEKVSNFIEQCEGNTDNGIYHDPAQNGYPTHGLGINFQGKSKEFIQAYIEKLDFNQADMVDHYIFDGTGWVVDTAAGKRFLVDEIMWLSESANVQKRPFDMENGIPVNSPIRLISNKDMNSIAFGEVVYDAYLNGKYGVEGVISSVGADVWEKLEVNERLALFSLHYNNNKLVGNRLKAALSTYTDSQMSDETREVAKLSAWFEILYGSNGGDDNSIKKGIQNRRFMEANAFLGTVQNKVEEGTDPIGNNSFFPVGTYEEASVAVAFMNSLGEYMMSYLNDIDCFAYRKEDIVRNHFKQAITQFLQSQNLEPTKYNLDTLFVSWNIKTDMFVSVEEGNRGNLYPTGDILYKNVEGSNLNDLIVITGKHNGIEVRANEGNDEIYGGKYNDIIYSGKGDDFINAGDGNDEVYTTDGSVEDYNKVYLGAGSDIFVGGDGNDEVDGGNYEDTANDINNVDLGGGQNRYIGSVGKDIVSGSGYNTVYLGAGSDEYYGGDGVDIVDGGTSADSIIDKNVVYLFGGDDQYKGGDGQDIVYGGSGNNTISLGRGSDEYYGGDDVDTVEENTYSAETDINKIYLRGGNDSFSGGSGRDIVYGGTGDDYLGGGDGKDELYGEDGIDIIRGGAGSDILDGGDGDDKIYGDGDSDILIGGKGNDYLEGGVACSDTYVYNLGDGLDRIYDYGDGEAGDIIKFGEGISYNDFEFKRKSGTTDLYMLFKNDSSQGIILESFYAGPGYTGRKNKTLEFADGSSVNLEDNPPSLSSPLSISSQNASDLLTQALSTFGADSGSRMDMSETGGTVSEMYDLACGYDLTKKTA